MRISGRTPSQEFRASATPQGEGRRSSKSSFKSDRGPKALSFGFSFLALLAAARTLQSRGLRVPALPCGGAMKIRTNFLLDSSIFSKQLALLLALLLEATLLWAGDKPWKTKPYQQWAEKDLQTILADSQWVRITTIRRTWVPVSEKDIPDDPKINGGARQMPAGGGQVGRTRT